MLQITRKSRLILADDTTVVIELSPQEMDLIRAMRNFQHGELTVKVRNGVPQTLIKTVEYQNLTSRVEGV